MLLRKLQGGCSIGELTWENDGDAIEVPDELANQLLNIRGGDFEYVPPAPEPAKPVKKTPAKKTAADTGTGTEPDGEGDGDTESETTNS